jgi:hypothetical protein
LPVLVRRPSVVSSFKPRLRMVFIMPGMENLAPERTLSSSGSFASPSFLPRDFSSLASILPISSSIDCGTVELFSK